ncbi:MAG: GxxExxY protein [Ignavibacteriae bacterium]|nr:GxxExxY protein [Ignavibacteriota bacterium]
MTATKLLYADITEAIIGAAFHVHNTLGPGLSEKTYQTAIAAYLREKGYNVEEEKVLPLFFKDTRAGEQRVDLLVDNKVIVETKVVHKLLQDYTTKLLACLRNTKYQVGLLINFGSKVEFKRIVHSTEHKY